MTVVILSSNSQQHSEEAHFSKCPNIKDNLLKHDSTDAKSHEIIKQMLKADVINYMRPNSPAIEGFV